MEKLLKLLKATGLPVAYSSFPATKAPTYPFVTYKFLYNSNFNADGKVYEPIARYKISLFCNKKDLSTEEKVEKALDGYVWDKEETELTDKKAFEIDYEVEI